MKSKPSEENTVKYYDIVYEDWINDNLTKEEIHLIKSLVKHGGTILDVGSGTGRHSIPLYKTGYKVTGIDPIYNMKKKLQSKQPEIKVINKGLLDVELTRKFDGIIIMWNTFNQLCYTKRERDLVLSKLLN